MRNVSPVTTKDLGDYAMSSTTAVLERESTTKPAVKTPAVKSVIVNGVWRLTPVSNVPGADCMATHLLTTWEGSHLSLSHARRYLTRFSDAEHRAMMRRTSRHALINPRSTKDDVRRARRVIEVLDGMAVPVLAGAVLEYGPDVADMRCDCGGYLVSVRGQLEHVDCCEECFDVDGPQGMCEDRDRHVMCMKPAAQVCEHNHCRAAGDLTAVPCVSGKDACCGCCHGDLDR